MLKKLTWAALRPVHWFGLLLAAVLLIWVVRLCRPEGKPVTPAMSATKPPVILSTPSQSEQADRAKLDSLNALNP